MLTGIWKDIEIYCGNEHSELIKLEPRQGPLSLFYACPKYYEENRTELEHKCDNRISLNEYEALVEHISDKITDAELNDQILNLKGYCWKNKGVLYEVIEHSKKIKIKVTNIGAMGKYNLH